MNPQWQIYPLVSSDREWVKTFMIEHWCSEEMIVHGEAVSPAELPGFVCSHSGTVLGLITYRINEAGCEVMSLDSLQNNRGIGSTLLQAVIDTARQNKCRKVSLITTNDNLNALGFYQKRDFCISGIFPGAVTKSRLLKPSIPLIAENGIPIRDEIELTLVLE
jgi:GNAT superfamily N-acetyltransferase